jgi:hypothetical protein
LKLKQFLSPGSIVDWVTQHWFGVTLTVVGANIFMISGDVYMAHHLELPAASFLWLPVYFSLVCGFLLTLLGLIRNVGTAGRLFHQALLWSGVLVGAAGFYFHINRHFLGTPTLKSLVYTAPIAAPLVFAGISLFGLAVLKQEPIFKRFRRTQILILLVSGGFAGNALLSLLDHAQNHFFSYMEWFPVVASLFATFHCFLLGLKPRWSQPDRGFLFATLSVQIIFGLLGFYLHLKASLPLDSFDDLEKLFHVTPVLAPLLMANVAAYGILTLLAPETDDS